MGKKYTNRGLYWRAYGRLNVLVKNSPNNFEFYSLVTLAQNSKTAEINVKNLIHSQEMGTL